MNLVLKLLVRVGITRQTAQGWHNPIQFAPLWCWKKPLAHARFCGWFGLFRNRPDVISRIPGRWLPRRWGFHFMGLIEIGDRG